MNGNTGKLSEKELLFCIYYCQCRDSRLSAVKAGFLDFPEKQAAELMQKTKIKKKIESLSKQDAVTVQEIISGYRRLAFGSVTDALKLIFLDEVPDDLFLETLDLFGVSEIKRPKSGGVEIKFFDRMKSLERLETISGCQNTSGTAESFYKALDNSVDALED